MQAWKVIVLIGLPFVAAGTYLYIKKRKARQATSDALVTAQTQNAIAQANVANIITANANNPNSNVGRLIALSNKNAAARAV